MGQKINPIGLRLGINRGWDSTWFAKKKDFGKYLIEDFKIRNYIKKNREPTMAPCPFYYFDKVTLPAS